MTNHRDALVELLGGACQCCGDDDSRLHVHHIDRNRSNNSPDNLRLLCPSCHHHDHLDERYGGLDYHVEVLEEELAATLSELESIREDYSGEEKRSKVRSEVLSFKDEVRKRVPPIRRQVDGILDKLPPEVRDGAEEVRASYQGELGDDVPDDDPGFVHASEIQGDDD